MAESAATTGAVVDPYRSYNFKVEIQGVTEGHFSECSGVAASIQAIRYREGGGGNVVRRLPGQVEYSDVTLRFGLTKSRDLWDWFQTAATGKVLRKNVSIVLMETDGTTEAMRWNLINAWPSAWHGAPLDALGREVAIATLVLVYESLEQG
jgi:phage tail-like protein